MVNLNICVPCYNETLFNQSVAKKSIDGLINPSFSYTVHAAYGSRISCQRNALINEKKSQLIRGQKLDPTYTHWLFMDSDIECNQGHILKLLSDEKEIVSGAYVSRANPELYEAWVTDGNGLNLSYVNTTSTGLHKIEGGTGIGLLLATRDALERMTYPWFSEYVVTYGDLAESFAEDAYFAKNARSNGIEIWLDCDCIVKHHV
jgi:hypothetical protein